MNAYVSAFEEERHALAASERWARAKVVELERNAENVREGLRLMDTALIRGADCRRWRLDPRWREVERLCRDRWAWGARLAAGGLTSAWRAKFNDERNKAWPLNTADVDARAGEEASGPLAVAAFDAWLEANGLGPDVLAAPEREALLRLGEADSRLADRIVNYGERWLIEEICPPGWLAREESDRLWRADQAGRRQGDRLVGPMWLFIIAGFLMLHVWFVFVLAALFVGLVACGALVAGVTGIYRIPEKRHEWVSFRMAVARAHAHVEAARIRFNARTPAPAS